MPQITIAELPEALQKLLQEAEETDTPLTITKEGQPFAVVYPAKKIETRPAPGFRKNSGKILGDIVSPLSREIELPHQDPADRFLAATAIHYGLTLATVDANLVSSSLITTIS